MKQIKTLLLLVLVITIALPAFSADKVDSKIRFNDFYGEVKIRPNAEEDDSYEFVDLDTVIYEDDRIKTEEDSGAILGLEDMSTYVIKPETVLIIHTEEGNVSKIEMIAGTMWCNFKKIAEGKSLEIEMSQCVAGINGTTIIAQDNGNESTFSVTKGKSTVTSKINGIEVVVEEGQTVVMDNNGNVLRKELDPEIQKSFQEDLDKSNDKLEPSQIKEKLEGQTKEIEQQNTKLTSAFNEMKSEAGSKSIEELQESLPKYNNSLQEGKRFIGIYEEVNSSIKSYASRNDLNKQQITERNSCIKKARESMEKLNKTIGAIEIFISDLSKRIEEELAKQNKGDGNTESKDADSETQKELSNEIKEINEEADKIIRDVGEQSSYQDFRNAITNLEALLKDLDAMSSKLETITESNDKRALLKFYEMVKKAIEKAIHDFSSVPEITSASLKQMSDFDKDIPSFASTIRQYLNEYKSIEGSSTDAQKRYVETVTRTLASYDRMRRVYTKAEKLYKQINRDFSQASYKSSEYQEVYDSWLRVSDAMNELDSEASELSSCVEDLKSQLERQLGQ